MCILLTQANRASTTSQIIEIIEFFSSQIEHLYGLTVFENYLYATNSDNANMQPKTSVIRVNRFNSSDYQVVTRVDKGGALHVYHQRRQPSGIKLFLIYCSAV